MGGAEYRALKAINETQNKRSDYNGKQVKKIVAKLGSKKNPLILRIADDSKVDTISNICHENGWHFILGLEPDKEEDLTDLERKLSPPVQHKAVKIGRNELCTCGSGKKYKKCCGAA